MTTHFDTSDLLLSEILGRRRSLFADDVLRHRQQLAREIDGKRLLVVGAAGSIGAAFVKQIMAFRPAVVHMVDLNENTLVEVVRDLRSSPLDLPAELRTFSIDFASPAFARFAASHGPWDIFVNFSAVKHVRSERDVFSLMRMVETNVEALAEFLSLPAAKQLTRVFSVSTDKSVRPANLMGATKNLMEKVMFDGDRPWVATSARFANVAFSAGSLLEGFVMRLDKKQPLAAPTDTRRYFISHEEAGQLCLLGAFLGQDREVVFPKLDHEADLIGFADIATAFLRHNGLQPWLCATEAEARNITVPAGHWPCWFSPSETSGEKTYEEFCRFDDIVDAERFAAAGIVREQAPPTGLVPTFLDRIAAIRAGGQWHKADVVSAIAEAVPELEHVERHKSLDEKM